MYALTFNRSRDQAVKSYESWTHLIPQRTQSGNAFIEYQGLRRDRAWGTEQEQKQKQYERKGGRKGTTGRERGRRIGTWTVVEDKEVGQTERENN